jgi:hypothetical protein
MSTPVLIALAATLLQRLQSDADRDSDFNFPKGSREDYEGNEVIL